MDFYTVKLAELLSFDVSKKKTDVPAPKDARCAVIAGDGVSKELAEQFGRARYNLGVTVDVFTQDEAPQLLFSPTSQCALQQRPAAENIHTIPIIADDVSKHYQEVSNLTLSGGQLFVVAYTPGEDWKDSFKW